MAPYIPYLRRAVLTFLHSKLIHKKGHEVAIVLFGTRGTNNLVHDEAIAKDPANVFEYSNIVTFKNMNEPTFETMKEVDQAFTKISESTGDGFPADVVDALIVAWDVIFQSFKINPERKNYRTKCIILISNFISKRGLNEDGGDNGDNDSGRQDALASELLANNIALDVISLDIPGDEVDTNIQAIKRANNEYLDRLSTQINMKMRSIEYGADLAGVFPVGGELTSTHTISSMDLCLGSKLKIAVKFAIKTQQERTPSLGKESPLLRELGGGGGGGAPDMGNGDGASGSKEEEAESSRSFAAPHEELELSGIKKSIEYYRKDDQFQLEPVPPEDMIKGFRVSLERAINRLFLYQFLVIKFFYIISFSDTDRLSLLYWFSYNFAVRA